MIQNRYTQKTWFADKSTAVLFEPIAMEPPTRLVTACMVFAFDESGHLVLAKPKRGWGLPGGHREKGETPQECAKREFYEETNIRIRNLRIIGRQKIEKIIRSEHNAKYPKLGYILFYIADVEKIDNHEAKHEVSHRAFVPMEKMNDYIDRVNHGGFYDILSHAQYYLENTNKTSNDLSKKVSIIVPVYNTSKYLSSCLDSLISQSYTNIEIIAVNDASTDRSATICRRYQKNDSRIILIENTSNVGLAKSRNIGIRQSSGDYILFVDSDDYIDKFTVEKTLAQVEFTGAAICEFLNYQITNNVEFDDSKYISKEKISSGLECLENYLTHTKPGFTKIEVWNKLFNRQLFDNVVFPAGRYFEDAAIIFKLYANADKVAYIPSRFYYYRKRGGSITNSPLSQKKIDDTYYFLCETSNFINTTIPKLAKELDYFTFNMVCLALEQLAITPNDELNINILLSILNNLSNFELFNNKDIDRLHKLMSLNGDYGDFYGTR